MERSMQKVWIPWAIVGGFVLFSTSVLPAEDGKPAGRDAAKLERGQTEVSQGTDIVFRAASDQPLDGFAKMTVGDQTVFVAPDPAWTTGEIVSVSEAPDRLALQLTAVASDRIGSGMDRVAVFVDGHLTVAPRVSRSMEKSVVQLLGLLPGQIQRLSRVVTAAPVAPTGPTLVVVPHQTMVPAGGMASMDVFVSGMTEMRAFQVSVDVFGGLAGRMDLDDLVVDTSRADYVFAGQEAVHAADKNKGRALGAMYAGAVPALERAYLATYTFKVAPGSQGRFEFQVRSNNDTLLRDSHGLPVGFQMGPAATIEVGRLVRPAERQ